MSANFPTYSDEGCAHDWCLYDRHRTGNTHIVKEPLEMRTLFDVSETWYCRRCRRVEERMVIDDPYLEDVLARRPG